MPRTADEVLQPGKFSVPIFNDPLSAVGLLFGQDVDLIQYRAQTLEASFNYSQYIPIWPIFGITIGGSFNMVADFGFGYDTSGIRKFADTGRKIDLFDGFYLADTYTDGDGNVFDPAELQFSLGLTAGGEINLLAASAGVEGGLYATIDLNLNDPNLDGKVRAGELLANLQLGQHPLWDLCGYLTPVASWKPVSACMPAYWDSGVNWNWARSNFWISTCLDHSPPIQCWVRSAMAH